MGSPHLGPVMQETWASHCRKVKRVKVLDSGSRAPRKPHSPGRSILLMTGMISKSFSRAMYTFANV